MSSSVTDQKDGKDAMTRQSSSHSGTPDSIEKEMGGQKETPHLTVADDLGDKQDDSPIYRSETVTTNDAESMAPAKPQPKAKWYRKINPLRLRRIPPVPEERQVSKEYGAGFFSVVTFQWMSSIMTTGYLRRLELQDIWLVNPDRACETMTSKLEASFKGRVARGDRYPLLWATYETFKVEFWIGGICQFFASVLQVMSPFTTRYLIQFATDAWDAQHNHTPGPNIGNGLGIAIGITLMQILQCIGTSQFMYRGMLVGGQTKAVLINMIFSKAMRLSGRAKSGGKAIEDYRGKEEADDEPTLLKSARDGLLESMFDKKKAAKTGPRVTPDIAPGIAGDGSGWSNGRIITLMSVDADRIDQACGMFHILWTAPVIIIITLVVLVVNIGYSALSGYALLVLGVPLLGYAIRTLLIRRRSINKITDQRVSLTQEILQAVRFVKYFGWESSFLDRLKNIRKREIYSIQILLSIRNAILCVSMTLPIFASMLAFITYSLSQHVLTPAPIFSSLALFNSLRMPLNMLPIVISQVTDAWTAFVRIQEFFLAEEQSDDIAWKKDMSNAIEVDNASFTWERTPDSDEKKKQNQSKGSKNQKVDNNQGEKGDKTPSDSDSSLTQVNPFHLDNLTFTAGRNELLAVIGTVGCGKSSLLSALAGDMRMTDGSISMGVSSRAFCPQYAWIQNTTVKNNILFGQEYNEDWYKQVIEACALQADLEMLPAGDSTEIGERGITVSGGQKQRMNVARAIYFDADVILMDDPLSAVDAHVGRHIMDNAICGLLKDKCRILATHQLHILSRCDRIIVMNEGRIESIDTFDNLMKDSEVFQRLMTTTSQEEDEKKDDSDEDEPEVGKEKEQIKKSKKQKKAAALMQEEERAVDSVSWSVWGAYISAAGFILNWPLIGITLLLANGANVMTNLWLSYWTSNNFENLSQGQYIGIYAGLGGLQVLLMFSFSTILTTSGTNSSKTMLQRAMTRVLRAPMSFFDTTPLGRITNRFSKDVHTMDNKLADSMRIYFLVLTMIITVMVLIIVFFHYFAIALGPLFILFIFASNYYRASARELKRHEAVLRSSVFSQFGEGISGTASIRAYGLQDRFVSQLRKSIDEMNGAYFLTFSNQRWLGLRLDAVGTTMVLVTGILVVTSRFNVSPSISGLVLSYILATVQMFQFTVRQLAEMENDMNSTERLHYYGTQIEEEAPLHLADVDKSWPQTGSISFTDVEMRYRAGLPLVLRGLNMDVAGGERIGIVGRTGAGKSSIMSALFRLTELSGGSIKIDDVNIATIGLHDLRSRLAIIPQDPALFRGTVRSNLDPFNEHTDLELWSALRKADLVDEEEESPPANGTNEADDEKPAPSPTQPTHHRHQRIHLDMTVDEEGLNFSLGQRQLMALARALVRDSRIIVCDEATSSVDFETDQKIQQTMATVFKGKTLLCIAHRLRTIIHYDRICVMDQGRIAELDTPIRLWEGSAGEGVFRGMCDRSGIKREDFAQ
ncbi:hypothetical protein FQN54_003698 [Arachnomyces sp. PD_36]|nr:hypothetical protein FQN54_003698 [Arachnomyces sp. PD_36]